MSRDFTFGDVDGSLLSVAAGNCTGGVGTKTTQFSSQKIVSALSRYFQVIVNGGSKKTIKG